jgi:phospholipid/cholesterol/gamma-HCH transport system substrate-binding protein
MKKKDSFQEVMVGFFMLIIAAVLVYFTVVISGVDILGGKSDVLVNVVFSDVGGLKSRDTVMYRGTKVGVVEKINLQPENLLVTLKIDRNVVLREKYAISICSLSMLGGNYLMLEEGTGEKIQLGEATLKGEAPTDWMRDVSRIAKKLNEFTSGGELLSIVSNVNAVSKSAKVIASRLERGEGLVGKLLSSDETLYKEVVSVVSNTSAIASRLERGEGTLGKLLSSDETVYNDLKRIASSAADVSERISKGQGLLGRLVSKDDALAVEVEKSVVAFRQACEGFDMKKVVSSAETLLADLGEVAKKLKSGEGTLGKLINDSSLYDEVDGLSKDLRQVLDNYRDTTPITTFGSLVTGAL